MNSTHFSPPLTPSHRTPPLPLPLPTNNNMTTIMQAQVQKKKILFYQHKILSRGLLLQVCYGFYAFLFVLFAGIATTDVNFLLITLLSVIHLFLFFLSY